MDNIAFKFKTVTYKPSGNKSSINDNLSNDLSTDDMKKLLNIENNLNSINNLISEGKIEEALLIISSACKDFELIWNSIKKDPKCSYYSFNNPIRFNMQMILNTENEQEKDIEDISIGDYSISWMYVRYAYILIESGALNRAKEALEKAIKWDPFSVSALTEMATIQRKENNYKEGMLLNKEILKYATTPSDMALGYRQLGYINSELENWDLAYKLYSYSLLFEQSKIAMDELAYIVVKSGDSDYGLLAPEDEIIETFIANKIPTECSSLVRNAYYDELRFWIRQDGKEQFIKYREDLLKILRDKNAIESLKHAQELTFNYSLNIQEQKEIAKVTTDEYRKYLDITDDPDVVTNMLNDYAEKPSSDFLEEIELEFSPEVIRKVSVVSNEITLKLLHNKYNRKLKAQLHKLISEKIDSGKATIQIIIDENGQYVIRYIQEPNNDELDKCLNEIYKEYYTLTPPPVCYYRKVLFVDIDIDNYKNQEPQYDESDIEGEYDNAWDLAEAGYEKIKTKEYDLGLVYLNKAVELDPYSPDILLKRALYCMKVMGDYKQALEDMNIAVKEAPFSPFYKIRAQANLHLEYYEDAIKDFDAVINDDKEKADYEVYFGRGKAEYAISDYEYAIEDFDKAIELAEEQENEELDKIYYYRGLAKQKCDSSDVKEEAISDFERAYNINPQDKYKEAIDNFREL